jgi:microcystin-dependent protein
MSDPFLAEIRAFGFNFAPVNWLMCNGQTLPIQQYAALFSLIGTYYGGNGTTNFQLPNLQARVPMHWGTGSPSTWVLGEQDGTSTVQLLTTQMPIHQHSVQVAEAAGGTTEATGTPGPTAWLGPANPSDSYVSSGNPNATLAVNAIGMNGGSQPHDNMQPFLTVNFCIAIYGVFPTRS